MAFKSSGLEELISILRIQIGDTESTPTYSDETLHEILRHSVSSLMNRWNHKYFVDNDGVVQRDTSDFIFDYSSPPVIQRQDHRAIVLMASIMIKSGKKFSTSSNTISFRDEEISYSNIESSRQLSSSLQDDLSELETMLPKKKLAKAVYSRLYGEVPDYKD